MKDFLLIAVATAIGAPIGFCAAIGLWYVVMVLGVGSLS